jgi:ATP-binding cassette subfamily F protein 3
MSTILKFIDVKQSFTENDLYYDVSGEIHTYQKIGLIGQNGTGKSTLLRILIDHLKPDSGQINRGYHTLGYVPQDAGNDIRNHRYTAILDVCMQFHPEIGAKYVELKKNEEGADDVKSTYIEALGEFQELAGYEYQQKVIVLLQIAGFDEVDIHLKEFSELSEGQKRLVYLISVIARSPEFLALDEPTNHVDHQLRQKYIEMIKNYSGTVLVVSHDRELLSDACTHIWELEDGLLQRYKGNWEEYVTEHFNRTEVAIRNYSQQEKELERLQKRLIETQRLAKLYSDPRFKKRINYLKRRIERVENAMAYVKPSHEKDVVRANLKYDGKQSQFPLKIENLEIYTNSNTIVEDFNIKIKSGEKVELRGGNGAGKSTIIKAILGKLSYAEAEGNIVITPTTKIGYFNQTLTFMDENESLFQYIQNLFHTDRTRTHGLMGKYMFDNSFIDTQLKDLSGGEKNRVHLMRLIEGDYNFLILDEPTNHLDLYAMQSLEEMLVNYNGTLLLISHDRYFAGSIVNRVVEV